MSVSDRSRLRVTSDSVAADDGRVRAADPGGLRRAWGAVLPLARQREG